MQKSLLAINIKLYNTFSIQRTDQSHVMADAKRCCEQIIDYLKKKSIEEMLQLKVTHHREMQAIKELYKKVEGVIKARVNFHLRFQLIVFASDEYAGDGTI